MKISFLILCLLLALPAVEAAEPSTISGTVTDAEGGEPVAGVVVKAARAFTTSNADGRFSLAVKAPADSVTFRCMGYESVTLPLSADFSVVRLRPKTTQLRDVIIEAPDIYARGDTLVFNVSRFAKPEDNAIIDVIKRLPGITVDDNGTIKYQGKPINKFYLDGNDFLGGQYGLVTNNLSYKDVASVELMENHQPVKALEGIEFPEEAGINLKLKEDARSRWVGVAQGGAGFSPLLYDASVFAMRMARKVQNMLTLKANNAGWNPASQVIEHDFYDMFDDLATLWPEYISADKVSAPLAEKRTRDNSSWLANAITAWKAGDASMRMKLNYMGDRLDYLSGLTTDYLDSSIPSFVEDNALRTRAHDLSAQFNAEINRRDYYLKDKLTVNAIDDRSRSGVSGSFDVRQHIGRRRLSAVNDLKLVKRNDRKVFTLTSRNSFDRDIDRLDAIGEGDVAQLFSTTGLRSTTETQLGRITRFWRYYLEGGLDLDARRFNTALTGIKAYDNRGVYNSFLSDLYVRPRVDFDRGGWRLSLRAPLKWRHHSLDGRHDYIETSPTLSVRRQLTSKSELTGAVSYRLGAPQPAMALEAPVLSDYRNIFIARDLGGYSHRIGCSAEYRYRNPLKAFFANVSASYSHTSSSVINSQLFVGDYVVTTYADKANGNGLWQLSGGVSKGLGHSRFVIGCEINSSFTKASSMRDGATVPYSLTSLSAKPYFKGSVAKWLSMNYEATYVYSRFRISGEPNTSHSLVERLSATVIPDDCLQLTAAAEHYFTRFPEGNSSNLILLDLSAAWQIRHRLRLSLTADNLLDRRLHDYITYGTLSRSQHRFTLRPRTLLATLQYRF